TVASGFALAFNGVAYDCLTGGQFVADYRANEVFQVDVAGVRTPFASVPDPDELVLRRDGGMLAVTSLVSQTIYLFDRSGTQLGTIVDPQGVTGLTFDEAGNLYTASAAGGPVQIHLYRAETLPPNVPVAEVWADGLEPTEGIQIDSTGRMFA